MFVYGVVLFGIHDGDGKVDVFLYKYGYFLCVC